MTSSLIRGRLAAELPVMVRVVAERLQVASPAAARAALKRIARASPSSTIIISSCPSSSFPRAIALSCEKQVQNTVLHRQSRVPRGSSSSSPTSSSPRASSSSSPRPAGHRRRRSQPFRLQCARARRRPPRRGHASGCHVVVVAGRRPPPQSRCLWRLARCPAAAADHLPSGSSESRCLWRGRRPCWARPGSGARLGRVPGPVPRPWRLRDLDRHTAAGEI